MPEYISKDVAFQRLLCKESEFNHWNDYLQAEIIRFGSTTADTRPCAATIEMA